MSLVPSTAPKLIRLPSTVPLTLPAEMQFEPVTPSAPTISVPCWARARVNVPTAGVGVSLVQVPIHVPDSGPRPVAAGVGVAVGVPTGDGDGEAVGEAVALGVAEAVAVVFGLIAVQALRPPSSTIAAAVPERTFLTAAPIIGGLLLEIIGGGPIVTDPRHSVADK